MAELKKEMEKGIKDLVQWASNIGLEEIPEATLRRAVLIIADDLAAMVASRNEPEVVSIHEQILRNTTREEATIFCKGQRRTDRFSAAIGNAIAANWSELDEGYRKATCHAGLYTLPALLAEAEAEAKTVGEVLRATVISYEVITRVARGWVIYPLILHPHAALSAVGAASAIASLRRLNVQDFLDALTCSATLVLIGPFNHGVKGALVRNMWAASGAWHGFKSVEWARCGIGGLESTFYDVYTVALGGTMHPEQLTCKLGEEWAIHDGYHKIFACCQYSHSAVEATLALLADLPSVKTSWDIKRVVLETHACGLTLDNCTPETSLAAKFSMPHIVAATLIFGHAGVEAFDSLALRRPEIAKLRDKIELRQFLPEQPPPNDRPARVTVELTDGRTITRECMSARGGPDKPFTEEEILEKGTKLTSDVYPKLISTLAEYLALTDAKKATRWDGLVNSLVGSDKF
jgi:2-methylcitrate dehydratase PrpD